MIEVVDGAAAEIADVEKAGIVDETINRAKSSFGLLDRRRESRVVGDVPLGEAMRHIAEAIDRRRMSRHQKQRMSLARERLRQGASDAMGRTGNDGEWPRHRRPSLDHTGKLSCFLAGIS